MASYEVQGFYTARKTITVKAKNRDEAIQKASNRFKDMGLEVTHLKAPFLEGDEQ